MKLLASSVESFAHRGSCFRTERALLREGINWHYPNQKYSVEKITASRRTMDPAPPNLAAAR
jgi:hypothetical protein